MRTMKAALYAVVTLAAPAVGVGLRTPAPPAPLSQAPHAPASAGALAEVPVDDQIQSTRRQVRALTQQLAALKAHQAGPADLGSAAAVAGASDDASQLEEAAPRRPLPKRDRLSKLQGGLEALRELKGALALGRSANADDASKFATGALSEELSRSDSKVWSTIESMIGSVQNVTTQMKGKSKEEQKALMASLEGDLNSKAGEMSKVTNAVDKKQKEQNEEYLLGLLMLHQGDWSVEKQLNSTKVLMGGSPVIEELYRHHDSSRPLTTQLAALMDAARAKAAATAASAGARSAPPQGGPAAGAAVGAGAQAPRDSSATAAAPVVHPAAVAAARLFLQLAGSLRG